MALSVLCFLGVSGYFVTRPSFSLFHPLTFYSAFHGFIFVFRPIVVWAKGYTQIYQNYDFTPSESDKLIVILASNLGYLAFAYFCLMSGDVAMRFKQDRVAIEERERLKVVLPFALAICGAIGMYSLSITLYQAGAGIGNDMVMDSATGVFANTTGNGYVFESQLMLATCGALIAWMYRFRLIAFVPLISFIVLKAGTGGRGPFVTALVSTGLLYLYEHRMRLPGFKFALALVAVVLAFNAVGDDRGRAVRQVLGKDQDSEVFGSVREERWLEGMDFANLEYFEYLVYIIPQRTHTYGYFIDTLQIFTEPVPRAIWKSKPVGAPFNNIYLMNYGRPIGMTRSLPGQGWYSLGWLGVIIWCGLWGYALGKIYRRFVEGPQTTIKVAAYVMFLPIMIVAFRDGQLITVLRQGLFFLAPIVLWHLLARYAGIPNSVEMRAYMARKALRLKGARGAAQPAQPAVENGLTALPPAVQRRRLALARERGGAA